VSAAAVLVVLVALPFGRRWSDREAAFAATGGQWTRLQALVANEDRLRRAVDEQRLAQRASGTRLVTGTSPALAASNLQVLIQRYADESSIQLDRVDIVSQPRPDSAGLLAIPAQVQGQGDVYGLVDVLYRLERGDKLLVVDEMVVNAGPEGQNGRQYLSWSIRLHGLYSSGDAGL